MEIQVSESLNVHLKSEWVVFRGGVDDVIYPGEGESWLIGRLRQQGNDVGTQLIPVTTNDPGLQCQLMTRLLRLWKHCLSAYGNIV
jgi:hypothetical protein